MDNEFPTDRLTTVLHDEAESTKAWIEDHRPTLGSVRTDQLLSHLAQGSEPPIVRLQGHFDHGKTTVINSLLGDPALPTGSQPETFAITYLRHISQRPRALTAAAYVLDSSFDPARWRDADHVLQHVKDQGDTRILQRTSEGADTSALALVFLDAPILTNCTLVDTPGTDEHTDQQQHRTQPPDAVILVDQLPGFMRGSSIDPLLTTAIDDLRRTHPGTAWDRVAIVCTHIPEGVPETELRRVFDQAARRAGQHASLAADADVIRSRMVPFRLHDPGSLDAFRLRTQELLGLNSQTPTATAVERILATKNAIIDALAPPPSQAVYSPPQASGRPTSISREQLREHARSGLYALRHTSFQGLDKVRNHYDVQFLQRWADPVSFQTPAEINRLALALRDDIYRRLSASLLKHSRDAANIFERLRNDLGLDADPITSEAAAADLATEHGRVRVRWFIDEMGPAVARNALQPRWWYYLSGRTTVPHFAAGQRHERMNGADLSVRVVAFLRRRIVSELLFPAESMKLIREVSHDGPLAAQQTFAVRGAPRVFFRHWRAMERSLERTFDPQ